MRKILPTAYLLFFLLTIIIFHFLFPSPQIVTPPYHYLGILLILAGIWLNIWADCLFKKKKTAVKPLEKPSALITEGPFRFSRHPMYLGFVLLMIGVAVLLGSVVAFLAPMAMLITLEMIFIPYEEKTLEEIFGQKYSDYKKRVRRWL